MDAGPRPFVRLLRDVTRRSAEYTMEEILESYTGWLDDPNRPSTILHKVIQQRILDLNAEQELDQQTTTKLISDLQEVVEASTQQITESELELKVIQSDYELLLQKHEHEFDLWQQEVTKYLKMLYE